MSNMTLNDFITSVHTATPLWVENVLFSAGNERWLNDILYPAIKPLDLRETSATERFKNYTGYAIASAAQYFFDNVAYETSGSVVSWTVADLASRVENQLHALGWSSLKVSSTGEIIRSGFAMSKGWCIADAVGAAIVYSWCKYTDNPSLTESKEKEILSSAVQSSNLPQYVKNEIQSSLTEGDTYALAGTYTREENYYANAYAYVTSVSSDCRYYQVYRDVVGGISKYTSSQTTAVAAWVNNAMGRTAVVEEGVSELIHQGHISADVSSDYGYSQSDTSYPGGYGTKSCGANNAYVTAGLWTTIPCTIRTCCAASHTKATEYRSSGGELETSTYGPEGHTSNIEISKSFNSAGVMYISAANAKQRASIYAQDNWGKTAAGANEYIRYGAEYVSAVGSRFTHIPFDSGCFETYRWAGGSYSKRDASVSVEVVFSLGGYMEFFG